MTSIPGAEPVVSVGAQPEVYQAPVQPKPWGREVIFAAVEGKYVGKVIHVNAGHSLSLQFHQVKEETISLISGRALFSLGTCAEDLQQREFGVGDTVHVLPGMVHQVEAITDVAFVECSTAQLGWREDVVRLADRYGRQGTSAP